MSKVIVIVVGESGGGRSLVASAIVRTLREAHPGIRISLEDPDSGGRTPERDRDVLEALVLRGEVEIEVEVRNSRAGARGWTTNP